MISFPFVLLALVLGVAIPLRVGAFAWVRAFPRRLAVARYLLHPALLWLLVALALGLPLRAFLPALALVMAAEVVSDRLLHTPPDYVHPEYVHPEYVRLDHGLSGERRPSPIGLVLAIMCAQLFLALGMVAAQTGSPLSAHVRAHREAREEARRETGEGARAASPRPPLLPMFPVSRPRW